MIFIVTGAAGFIGSSLVGELLKIGHKVIGIDNLSYSSNLDSLQAHKDDDNFIFQELDIRDKKAIDEILEKYKPKGLFHLAAQTHVDRSIDGPKEFIEHNIIGTFSLLESTRSYFESLSSEERAEFRFLHISTDEVFGSLNFESKPSRESDRYEPSSPYSASKASSDHLVLAWYKTYGLPVLVTNCTNNYGPWQFPEKLIPRIIFKALRKERIEIYGDGSNIRDWLFVNDHAKALILVMESGSVGNYYNVGGESELSNIDLCFEICDRLDNYLSEPEGTHSKLISFVADRPGHDLRYSLDISKIKKDLGYSPVTKIDEGLSQTIQWYLNNQDFLFKEIDLIKERLGN